jgi:hypothetical protein
VSWALAACLTVLGANHACGQTADVVGAFEKIPDETTLLTFDRGAVELPRGGHLQGIQMRFDAAAKRHVVFLSHDSTTVAYLAIVEFPEDLTAPGRLVHVHTFPSDGRSPPLRHAGGIQLAGDVLAVGLEDNQLKTRSEIQFWNVARPGQPVQLPHLTIRRSGAPEDKTAGAVGIVKRKNDYLVAAGNWDSRAIDFYTSNGKPLDDPLCRFELAVRWRDDAADKKDWQPDKVFGEYQALNLAADANENLFLIGPHTGGNDVVDLFAIDLRAQPDKLLRKLASKSMRLPVGMHFRHAAGVWITKDGLAILSSPRNFSTKTRISIAQ